MANSYLTRTETTGNRRTWTWSGWVKLSETSIADNILWSSNSPPFYSTLFFSDYALRYQDYYAGSINHLKTNQFFRDINGWYHIVVAMDTTQATTSDRIKMYVNGEQITSFNTANYPSLNYDSYVNVNGYNYEIGTQASGSYYNGSMAHVHFIDGTAYDASAFGETDATTGIWKPKTAPSVTYGTNGFFLKFENSGSIGTDSSGNANNFTVGGGTPIQIVDTPSNVFATYNPLIKTGATFSNGNLSLSCGALASYEGTMATIIPTKGKWYGEIKVTDAANLQIGFITADTLIDGARSVYSSSSNIYWQDNVTVISYYLNGSYVGNATVTGGSNSVPTYTTNDIIMLAMDLDNGYGWFGKNGTWQNSGNPASGTNAFNLASDYANGTTFFTGCLSASVSANFGNGYFGTTAVSSAQNPDDGIGIFEYTVPTGYKALCTKSINAQEYA
jgi:hypothetical protein